MNILVRMVRKTLNRLRSTLERVGISIRSSSSPLQSRLSEISGYLYVTSELPQDYLRFSRSQFGQDALVLKLLGERKGMGYFVEFGAIDGLNNSNTFYFEKALGWSGILSEPSKRWHEKLRENRDCHIDERCVYSCSGCNLQFGDTGEWKGGNTLISFANADGSNREFTDVYSVETVSLTDLLDKFGAPKYIDFLSIDTEGSELEILKPFDFDQYQFGLLLVEHNFDHEKRSALHQLLTSKGYFRLPIPDEVGQVDDWYALGPICSKFNRLCGDHFPFEG